jgi:hypothetical protein
LLVSARLASEDGNGAARNISDVLIFPGIEFSAMALIVNP